MKLLKNGKNTLVSIEKISSFGIWIFINNKEYFLSYKDYPYFENQSVKLIRNVELHHGFHLYWPELDVDLHLDNLENPEKYPLKAKVR